MSSSFIQTSEIRCLWNSIHKQTSKIRCLLASFHELTSNIGCLLTCTHRQSSKIRCLWTSFHKQNSKISCILSIHEPSMSLQVTLDVYWLLPTGRVVKLDVCGSRQSSVRWSTSTRSSRWRSSGGRRQRRRRWRRSLREAASTNRTGSGDSPTSFPQIPLSRRQWQDLNRWP